MHRWVEYRDGTGFTLHGEAHHEASCIVTELSGWFEGSEVRVERTARLGDGEFPSPMWRKGRDFNLAVLERFETPQQVIARAREVSGVYRSGELGSGSITADFEGLPRLSAEQVALDARPRVTQNLDNLTIRYELPLYSPDPCLYGPALSTQAFTALAGQGLVFPLFDNEAGQTTGVLEFGELPAPPDELTNSGNATAYPRITVTGSFPNGFTLDVVTAGRVLGVTYRQTVSPQSPVLVDFSGSVTVDGVEQSWALVRRDWGGVEPQQQMTVRLEALSAEGVGSALVELRPTYL